MRRDRVSSMVKACGLFAVLLVACFLALPIAQAAADSQPPTVPASLAAVPGVASPTIASLSWAASTDDNEVGGYYVWRAVSLVTTPRLIGETPSLAFTDTSGVPGQAYYYRVSAFDTARNESGKSASVGPISAAWPAPSPHLSYGATGGSYCALCHVPHVAASQVGLMRPTGQTPGEITVCYTCHDGQGGPNVKTGADNSFALQSGHSVENSGTGGDLTDRCSGCHTAHKDPVLRPSLPGELVNGQAISKAGNTWCLACHNDTSDWFVGSYPSVATPSRDASGYPTSGTFPGRTVYANPALNAHASIPASGTIREQGDCLYCHDSHRANNKYDGLFKRFSPTTTATVVQDQTTGAYAESCYDCHGGVLRSEFTTMPVNIKQFTTAGAPRSGHRIKTAGGTLPVGAPLPCYNCHNPHGSSRGNGALISDALGQSLDTTTPAGVRSFCFSCHSSSNGFVWNSTSATYLAVGTQLVEGLRRSGADGSLLRLPVVGGHASGDTQSCYTCHGSNYAPGGSNVHNPTGGISDGGVPCYDCHATYSDYMEDGTGAKVGSQRTTAYHHVLGGSFNGGAYADGDIAPGPAGVYPTSGVTNLFCTVCHVDHDVFNSNKAANLREQYPSYVSNTNTSTDFSTTHAMGGLCTSCHGLPMPKDVINQKTDGTNVAASLNIPRYKVSAHQYSVVSTFSDGSSFNANCSKCHNDEQTKDFQTSVYKFGTHWSAVRRVISALGATLSDPLQEAECYRCHSRTTDSVGGTKKSAGLRDWYNATAMTAESERVWAQFQLASKHPVVASAGNSVECENCHNPHAISTTARVSNPDNTLSPLGYSTATEQAAFCLKCHDGAPPAYLSDGASYVPNAVTLTGSGDNKSTYASRAHWTAGGSIGTAQSCASCHDNHGSQYPKLIGAYDMITGTNRISGQPITGNNNTVCQACHNGADVLLAAPSRNASGYPVDGAWPGFSTYTDATFGIHRGAGTVVWPGTLYASGDCKNCHDVHGTANAYDELRGTFTPARFDTCFVCHDADGPAASNVASWFPAASGGTASDSTRRLGHKTVEAGNLPAGSALPCYDCHNPHGSAATDGLTVVTMTSSTTTIVVGDAAGEVNMSTAAGVRQFCMTCHIPSDTSNGWNGTAYVAVTTGARVEGLDRLTSLKLSTRTSHQQTNANSCYTSTCHASAHYPE